MANMNLSDRISVEEGKCAARRGFVAKAFVPAYIFDLLSATARYEERQLNRTDRGIVPTAG